MRYSQQIHGMNLGSLHVCAFLHQNLFCVSVPVPVTFTFLYVYLIISIYFIHDHHLSNLYSDVAACMFLRAKDVYVSVVQMHALFSR